MIRKVPSEEEKFICNLIETAKLVKYYRYKRLIYLKSGFTIHPQELIKPGEILPVK